MIREPGTDVQGDDPVEPSHPETFHITAAARAYLRHTGRSAPEILAARDVWEALTGLAGPAARTYAQQIEHDAVTATIIPF